MKNLLSAIIIATLVWIALCIVMHLSSLPIVYWSTSNDECVRCVVEGENINCEDFDFNQKYERVWVK